MNAAGRLVPLCPACSQPFPGAIPEACGACGAALEAWIWVRPGDLPGLVADRLALCGLPSIPKESAPRLEEQLMRGPLRVGSTAPADLRPQLAKLDAQALETRVELRSSAPPLSAGPGSGLAWVSVAQPRGRPTVDLGGLTLGPAVEGAAEAESIELKLGAPARPNAGTLARPNAGTPARQDAAPPRLLAEMTFASSDGGAPTSEQPEVEAALALGGWETLRLRAAALLRERRAVIAGVGLVALVAGLALSGVFTDAEAESRALLFRVEPKMGPLSEPELEQRMTSSLMRVNSNGYPFRSSTAFALGNRTRLLVTSTILQRHEGKGSAIRTLGIGHPGGSMVVVEANVEATQLAVLNCHPNLCAEASLPLGSSTAIAPGGTLYLPSRGTRARPLPVRVDKASPGSAIYLDERYEDAFQLGAPVLDANGAVVGILKDPAVGRVSRIEYVHRAMPEVFRQMGLEAEGMENEVLLAQLEAQRARAAALALEPPETESAPEPVPEPEPAPEPDPVRESPFVIRGAWSAFAGTYVELDYHVGEDGRPEGEIWVFECDGHPRRTEMPRPSPVSKSREDGRLVLHYELMMKASLGHQRCRLDTAEARSKSFEVQSATGRVTELLEREKLRRRRAARKDRR